MSILVTGGAGYIGSHIVDKLCDLGENVIVFDNLSNGFKENLNCSSKFIYGDLTNQEDLNKVFKGNKISSIIHMAALKSVGESSLKINDYTYNNIYGSLNLISKAIEYKVDKFIFSSTAAVYGSPIKDIVNEDHQLKPINHYGFTKLYIERYLNWISSITSLKYISFRYFNAAGYSSENDLIKFKEKKPENLLPIVMEVANGTRDSFSLFGDDYKTPDGTCIRDYVHVNDLADAHIKAIEFLDHKKNMAINLSTSKGNSVLEIINRTEELTLRKISYNVSERRKGDPSILISSYQKANDYLGWSPKYSIDQIILSMWKLYK